MNDVITIKNVVKKLVFILSAVIIGLILFTDVFSSSEKKNFKDDINNLISTIKTTCEDQLLNGLAHTSNYTVKNSKITPNIDIAFNSSISGEISVNTKCETTLILKNDKYKAMKNIDSNLKINTDIIDKKCTLIDDDIKIGSEVLCNKEHFYIIDFNDNEVTLFSKYNINISGNKQDSEDTGINSINAVSFDEVNNRINPNNSYCQRTYYGCNVYSKVDGTFTNGELSGTINEDSTIKYYVDRYAIMLDLGNNLISSNLITKEKLNDLGCSSIDNTCINSNYKWLYDSTYWTSSYFDGSPSIVWRIQNNGYFGSAYANYSNFTGVRPVITITRSSING